jgi:hypothetical protein
MGQECSSYSPSVASPTSDENKDRSELLWKTESRLKKHSSVAPTTKMKSSKRRRLIKQHHSTVAKKTRRSKFGAFYDPIADTQDVFTRTFRSMHVESEGRKEGAHPFTRLFSFDDERGGRGMLQEYSVMISN